MRSVALRQPSAGLEGELLGRAKRLTRSRRRWRQMTVAVVAAAVLLVMVNVVAGQIYARDIAALTGQPTTGQRLHTTLVFAEKLRARQQLITNSLEHNGEASAQADAQSVSPRRPAVAQPLRMKPISIEALRARNRLINEILELNGDAAIPDKENRQGKHNRSALPFSLDARRAFVQAGRCAIGTCAGLWRGFGR